MLKAVPAKWDIDRNWAIFEEQIIRRQDDGIDVFITPECFLDGYCATEDDWTIQRFTEIAQDISKSDYIQCVCNLARQIKTYIVFGCTELLGNLFYNCALLVDRDGKVIGKYHKTHLQKHDHRFAPGQSLPVFEIVMGCAGVLICADRRWPESLRTLRLKGAKLCLMPTYGMWGLDNEWWMRTRSYENQMFVCFTHPNVALITGPSGEIEAKLQSNIPDVLIHDINLERATDDNHLSDRRPELYQVISDISHPSSQKPYNPPKIDDSSE